MKVYNLKYIVCYALNILKGVIKFKFYSIYTTLIKHILYQVLGSDFSFLEMTRGFHIFGPPLVNQKYIVVQN